MVASENGTSIMPMPVQMSVQQTSTSAMSGMANGKEKKPKGLFKAPSYPSSVLRPRAQVTAPIQSTAVDASTLPPPPENDPPVSFASSASALPVDSRTARILAARRVKELEREAKEKEYADGQHANLIDGVWHCSNCGCPESIAIGRRKGPLGDKSQCGTCGKFWHRHRRPRPVEYNADAEYHINLRREVGTAATTRRRGRAQNTSLQNNNDRPDTPSRSRPEVEAPSMPPASSNALPSEDDRAVSPVSESSSGSEPPLAQQFLKANGGGHASPAPPPQASTSETPTRSPAPRPASTSNNSQGNRSPFPTEPSTVAGGTVDSSYTPPPWLSEAMHEMQSRYPEDKFEAILRKATSKTAPEWRLKCLDCPGKLYTPGPGETLSNYEVHLRNRQHRQRVNSRLGLSS
ncbi:hypothetical protein SERLA73DRAFT_179083 [Serpula lacrymans var. lacrymans S7.3]|uniref:GATA-type domain-containing protein n=1 Tax=Serpula lacrymans var. lacrymans (strain S7.3) TaxID=936435 RepID=F8PTP7_SERL3|nr:hypothetical protein SERLA73DRAFT_179083 [Serpula lacrymans var. lacrymans S7.3]